MDKRPGKKSWRMRILTGILILFGCTLAMLTTGYAAQMIWISPTGEMTDDAIKLMEIEKKLYFFLPGNIDLNDYKIGFDSLTLKINGTDVVQGETSASLLHTGKANTVVFGYKTGKNKKSVTAMQGSELPVMYITTESGGLREIHKKKENKEKGTMALYDTDGKTVFSGNLKHIKMRGNMSVYFTKKNYIIKLESGANLLGMGKAKKWILLGNHLDKSLVRNQLNFDMARYAGLPYTPDCRQISLYINNEYMGTYLLTERVEIDDDRVDIRDLEKETEKMNEKPLESYPVTERRDAARGTYKGYQIPNEPEDITGGYLIEFEHNSDHYGETPTAYYTRHKMFLAIHSPEYCSEKQIAYITGLMQSFENAIFSEDGRDPETGKHYSDIVDFDSLVNKYLINEVSRNYDANMSSEYFYKPDDSVSTKVFAGPVWDMDNTYGDYARPDNKFVLNPSGMTASKGGYIDYWWPALYLQSDFYRAVVSRYHETFVPAMEILLGKREETETLKSIDTYAAAIEKNAEMEFILYPGLKYKRNEVQTGKNLKENIKYLKDYITKRMQFLNETWIAEE